MKDDKRNELRNKLKQKQSKNIQTNDNSININDNIIHNNENNNSITTQEIQRYNNLARKKANKTITKEELKELEALHEKIKANAPPQAQPVTTPPQKEEKKSDPKPEKTPSEIPRQPQVGKPEDKDKKEDKAPEGNEEITPPSIDDKEGKTREPLEKTVEPTKNDPPPVDNPLPEDGSLTTRERATAYQRNLEEKAKEKAEQNIKLQEQLKKEADKDYKQAKKTYESAREAREKAEKDLKKDPNNEEKKKKVAEAQQVEKDAQADLWATEKNKEKAKKDLKDAKNAKVDVGPLTAKKVSDPPGHEAENAEWLKSNNDKYKDVQKLDASQDKPSDMKYINFKQDYVVLIRKKPFYASTSQQRYATADVYETYSTKNGTVIPELTSKIQSKGEPLKDIMGRTIDPENNYLRVYQVNNFMNISINTTVNAPGTCSVTLKGAERVICAENDQQSEFGFFSWSDLAGSWLDINENGLVNDRTGIKYTTGSGFGNEKIARQNQIDEQKGIVSRYDSSRRHENYSGVARNTDQSWKEATSNWAAVEKGLFEEG